MAVLASDDGVDLASLSFGTATTDAFAGGARAAIYQTNTVSGGAATRTDVAVDWARLTTVPAAPTPLTLGALVSGNRTVETQRDLYTFTLAHDAQVVMDPRALPYDYSLSWTLSGERGVMGQARFYQRSWDYGGNPVMSLKAGTYTLKIDGNTTGAYGFALLDLGAATVLTPGTPQSGALDPGNSTALYAFDATAGDRVFFDMQSVTSRDSSWRLISPSGQQTWINSLYSDVDVTTLDQTGSWVLMLEGRRYQASSTNAFRFNVQPVVSNTTDITLGQQVGVDAYVPKFNPEDLARMITSMLHQD